MSKWWYVTLFACRECHKTWEEYDPKGSNYDSGLSTYPIVEELCPECFEAARQEDDLEEAI